MKLIDVRILKEWVENWFTKNRLYHPYAKNNNIPITELYDILEQIPPVDAVEVKICAKEAYDWTELMVICDNCGHAIHIKKEGQK